MATLQGTSGRVILHHAVGAVQDGRWDDLTNLLQSHSHELQSARRALEERALERHAAARKNAALKQDGSTHGYSSGLGGIHGAWLRSTAAVARWADAAPWSAILLSQVVVLAAYAPAFTYMGYIMDDSVAVQKNPCVVNDKVTFDDFWTRDYWGLPMHGATWTNKSFRPLTTWTFRLNYLLHGLESSGFHITNVLMHCIASIIVGRVAIDTLGLPGSWAAAAALFFGVHPVHTESVLYLVGRADVLSSIIGLLGINAYSRLFRRPPVLQPEALEAQSKASSVLWLVYPASLIVLSGLCKELGFTLYAIPILMELLDIVAAQAQPRHLQPSPREWRRIRTRVICLLSFVVLAFVARYRHTGGTEINMSPQDNPISFEASRKVRVLSYALLHGVYIRLLCWPHFLCYDYSMDAIPLVREFTDVRLMLPLAAYLLAMSTVVLAITAPPRHRRSCLISLALLVVPFLPASNILFPVGTVIGERLLYMPSVGFCLAVLVWLHGTLSTVSEHRLPSSEGLSSWSDESLKAKSSKKTGRNGVQDDRPAGSLLVWYPLSALPASSARFVVRAGCLVAVAATLLTVRCLFRVRVWESPDTLFITDGYAQLRSSKVQFNLGITYMTTQEWDLAVEALVRCAYADPLSSLPFFRIGQIEILRGNFESAERWLSAALDKFGASLMVRDEEVFHDVALAMFQNGKVKQAETRLQIALQLNPDFAKGWMNLACLLASRNIQDSLRAAHRAVQLAPWHPGYWNNLGILSYHAGDQQTAEQAWLRVQELTPGQPRNQDCTWEFIPAA